MHVFQLLNFFALAPKIEIVEAPLPELAEEPCFRVPASGESELYGLHDCRGICCPLLAQRTREKWGTRRFGDQQVNVLGHDDLSDDGETIALAHEFEDREQQVAGRAFGEKRRTAITAPGDEVQAPVAIVSLETPWHEES
jgi:hypothetical protein